MTHPKIISVQRAKDLANFRESLVGLGVDESYLDAMDRAGTSVLGGSAMPQAKDPLGQAAYNAAGLAALAQVVVGLSARIEELETQAAGVAATSE